MSSALEQRDELRKLDRRHGLLAPTPSLGAGLEGPVPDESGVPEALSEEGFSCSSLGYNRTR